MTPHLIMKLQRDVDPSLLGMVPYFLNPDDPRPAAEQFHENYAHGGGWNPRENKWSFDAGTLTYDKGSEDEEVFHPLFAWMFHEVEMILVYDCAWVLILQEDGSFAVSRMD